MSYRALKLAERISHYLLHCPKCPACEGICEKWQKFCTVCGSVNPQFDPEELKRETATNSAEEAMEENCYLWHELESPVSPTMPFCPLCGINIFGQIPKPPEESLPVNE
jgi:hypothetical protein